VTTIPDVSDFPILRQGYAHNVGGPPDDISQYRFLTPFALGDWHGSYQGPSTAAPATPTNGNGQALTIRTASRKYGLGILDRVLARIGMS
jgi:hypothetical protein